MSARVVRRAFNHPSLRNITDDDLPSAECCFFSKLFQLTVINCSCLGEHFGPCRYNCHPSARRGAKRDQIENVISFFARRQASSPWKALFRFFTRRRCKYLNQTDEFQSGPAHWIGSDRKRRLGSERNGTEQFGKCKFRQSRHF